MNDFQIGVAAVLWRDGLFLMHERKGSHGAGTWSFPGGHMDPEEGPRDTASRETREESGLVVAPETFRPVTFTIDVFKVEDKRYLTLYLEADCLTGAPQIVEPAKCAEWRWVKPGQWPGELFLPIRNFIDQTGMWK